MLQQKLYPFMNKLASRSWFILLDYRLMLLNSKFSLIMYWCLLLSKSKCLDISFCISSLIDSLISINVGCILDCLSCMMTRIRNNLELLEIICECKDGNFCIVIFLKENFCISKEKSFLQSLLFGNELTILFDISLSWPQIT